MPGMSHWRKDIGAITLFVEDPERAKLFYQEVFDRVKPRRMTPT